MALDDLLISTGVDGLIHLVKEKGRVEIGAVARELKLPSRTVEDWAHVLEEEGIITVEYKLTKVYLVWRTPEAKEVEQKREKLEEKAIDTSQEIEQLLSRVEAGGNSLSAMQEEIATLSIKPMRSSDIEALKRELAALQESYAKKIDITSQRLNALRKKAIAAGQKLQEKEGESEGERKAAGSLKNELAVLKKFEETLQSQLSDTEMFFEAFETRVDDLQKQIEEGRNSSAIEELKVEIENSMAVKKDLAEAVEAVIEEQKAFDAKMGEMENKLAELSEGENSIAAAKRKISSIRKMAEDAKKQKKAVEDHLSDSLSLIKKQSAKIEGALAKYAESGSAQALVDEYVEISEEMSRANEELAARQKDIGRKIAEQMSALEAAKSVQVGGGHSREEIQKVSFLLRELSHEQEMLEDKVKVLAKESDILKMESQPAEPGATGAVTQQAAMAGSAPPALVERVKLSQADEAAFDRKREELRSLIRKMWEEGKGNKGS
jgi:chromosome segregation ATPase